MMKQMLTKIFFFNYSAVSSKNRLVLVPTRGPTKFSSPELTLSIKKIPWISTSFEINPSVT